MTARDYVGREVGSDATGDSGGGQSGAGVSGLFRLERTKKKCRIDCQQNQPPTSSSSQLTHAMYRKEKKEKKNVVQLSGLGKASALGFAYHGRERSTHRRPGLRLWLTL